MSIGIKIENSKDIKIIGGEFSGLKTGIDVSHSEDVFVDNLRFKNVGTGVKAKNVKGLIASRCTDTNESRFKLTIISMIVKNYIENLKRNK